MAIAAFNVMKCTGSNASTETNTNNHPCFLGGYGADTHSTTTSSYYITIPSSSYNYSYEVWLRLKCTTAPDNKCENFKVYGPNTNPSTGVIVYMGTTDTGVTPVETASSVATTRQDTNYYGSSNALSISTEPSPHLIDAINEETDYIVLQLQVGSTASAGDIPTQHYYVEYDES